MIQILIGSDRVEVRRDGGQQVFEVIAGESVSLTPASVSIEQVEGEPATIDGTKITPAGLGASRYRLTSFDGTKLDLSLLTVESGCLEFVGKSIKSHGFGGEADTDARRRRILRSLATDRTTGFDGTLATLAGVPLQNFGA
ncbi:MAG TPA: hypothetical protein VHB79_10365 [Polyangiaceae bacterium]|nr:hypothetical protein [Polyangiaceae bacterium]